MKDELDRAFLREQAARYGIRLNEEAIERFAVYARLLTEWNEKINLTAITEPKEIVIKHFIDSITLLPLLPKSPLLLIDVGTGAGFPGVPLAIVNRQIRLTLLDSLNKRLVFLKECCSALEIPATLIHARAEEAGCKPEIREKFDVATARAVAALPVLCEYCLPLVKVGGLFISMKGPDAEEEIRKSEKAVSILGGRITAVEKRQLVIGEETMERRLVLIDKMALTPAKYPRNPAKIKKEPL